MLNFNLFFKDLKTRFIFVGILNTFVGYGVYALCLYLGMKYSPALLVTYIVGITHSYFWNKYFTFQVMEKSIGEVVRFLLVYIAIYLVNIAIIHVCVDKFKMDAYFTGVGVMFLTTAASYLGHKLISFRKKA